ncbi:MAG: sulfate adenylyltransferase, subunit 1 [Pseudomonadota bacterium]
MTQENIQDSLLRFMTCGSVDDGKSTLIGRLLFDTKTILTDTLTQIEKTSKKRGMTAVDLSLITDGLQAEREQGITIDVAYRYFSTGTRKYIIADAPGHEQYTRNMVTAASTAHLAIILIDARKGVLTQTRRHSFLAKLVGIPHVVVAINKMDLIDYDESKYKAICESYKAFAKEIKLSENRTIEFVPMSALNGDMIVDRGESINWYKGPTLLDVLEKTTADYAGKDKSFRFPVQFVCRPHASDNSGSIAVGDEITVLPSQYKSKIKSIQLGDTELKKAISEQSVTILLEDEIDISRGDMIIKSDDAIEPTKNINAMVCWLSETPMASSRTYLIRHTSRESKAKLDKIDFKVNIETLAHEAISNLSMNDIAQVTFKLAQPIMADPYQNNRSTGSFIIIDESTYHTVGAGMIA